MVDRTDLHTLERLLRWVQKYPGLSAVEHREKIVEAQARSDYQGTPAIGQLRWRLLYLELRGDIREEKKHWYPNY